MKKTPDQINLSAGSFDKNRSEKDNEKSRREFLKKAAVGGIAIGGLLNLPVEVKLHRLHSWKRLGGIYRDRFRLYANIPEVKKHLDKKTPLYFEPIPEWDHKRSHDRLWS